MLNPNNDRLDYGQILAPPNGYNLDFAVGTTYSLDLDALVGASLAMGLSEETDSALMENPICLLEALRSVGDKVALFCESGQIHMPRSVTSLYILLEKMVLPVKTEMRKRTISYPSFHPKFWLLRYMNAAGEKKYRVIVLSRNLTFDRSWDVVCTMDGYVGEEVSNKNEPICDFLRYLKKYVPKDEAGKKKAKAMRVIMKELQHVVFEVPGREFRDYEFIPNGIKRSAGGIYRFDKTRLFTDTFHEILVVSPFLSSDVIRNFNERNDESPIQDLHYTLFTREASLGKLKPNDANKFDIYKLKDMVIDGETAISEEQTDIQRQDIHAKMYMFLKSSQADLYLGSLNASHKALYENVEFMVKLSSTKQYLNTDKLKEALFGGDEFNEDNPFERTDFDTAIIDEGDSKQDNLEALIKQIARSAISASVTETCETFDLEVTFESCDTNNFQVSVQPLLSNKREDFGTSVIFHGLTVMHLSEFYVIAATDGEASVRRVIKIPTEGLPEGREKAVVTSVVSDDACFYRYIAFLLGDNAILSALEEGGIRGETQSAFRQGYQIPALYEKMLKTAASNPEKFKGIEYLMRTISDDGIIPEDFEQLYDTFRKAVKL